MKAMFQLDENLQICLTRNKQYKTKPPTYCLIQQDFSIRKDKCLGFWMKGIYHSGMETMVLNGIQRLHEFLKKENYMLVTYMDTYCRKTIYSISLLFQIFLLLSSNDLLVHCLNELNISNSIFFKTLFWIFAVCFQAFPSFLPPPFQQDFNFVIWLPFFNSSEHWLSVKWMLALLLLLWF